MNLHSTCVLYTTATCNLNCNYCYIDKGPILQKIDKLLEDSYKDDYYYNFIKKIFNKENLRRIEFWGGEPSYGLKRSIPTVIKTIQDYPFLKEFMFSTNFTTSTCIKDIVEFCQIFKEFPDRDFILDIQLSLDGPEYLNDLNRGEKSTELFFKNFVKFSKIADNLLDDIQNLTILSHFKATLDKNSIKLLQTKEKIIEYYQYFESYSTIKNNYSNNDRWKLTLTVPNTATPSPYTQQDGINFANLCKLSLEIGLENQDKNYFNFYKNIIPYGSPLKPYCSNVNYEDGVGACGSGCLILGLLPQNKISVCHNGFVELLEDYKKQCQNNINNTNRTLDFNVFLNNNNNNLIYSIEDYEIYQQKMRCYYNNETNFSLVELTSLITTLAEVNQIDKKYLEPKEAIKAAHFIFSFTSSCIRDNLGITGSLYLTQTGIIRLMLNGAKDYIEYGLKHL